MTTERDNYPHRIDPAGCGCTDCLTGWSVPIDQATSEHVAAMFRGQLDNATHRSTGAIAAEQAFERAGATYPGDDEWERVRTEIRRMTGNALHVVQGNYGYGWEDLTASHDRAEARADLRAYWENDLTGDFRLITRGRG